jgi:hypothetical protein
MVKPYNIFSYWILLWYILYIFHITSYNPKFILIIAIIHNFFIWINKLFNYSLKQFIIFSIVFIVIKIIPYISIRNTKIKKRDIIFSILLLLLYLLWININNISLYKITIELNKDNGPLTKIINNYISRGNRSA